MRTKQLFQAYTLVFLSTSIMGDDTAPGDEKSAHGEEPKTYPIAGSDNKDIDTVEVQRLACECGDPGLCPCI
jgi:hypothetical protein